MGCLAWLRGTQVPASSVFGTKKAEIPAHWGVRPLDQPDMQQAGPVSAVPWSSRCRTEEFRCLAVRAVSAVYIMIVSALVTGTRTDVSTAVTLASWGVGCGQTLLRQWAELRADSGLRSRHDWCWVKSCFGCLEASADLSHCVHSVY